jgi:hypothetical protein
MRIGKKIKICIFAAQRILITTHPYTHTYTNGAENNRHLRVFGAPNLVLRRVGILHAHDQRANMARDTRRFGVVRRTVVRHQHDVWLVGVGVVRDEECEFDEVFDRFNFATDDMRYRVDVDVRERSFHGEDEVDFGVRDFLVLHESASILRLVEDVEHGLGRERRVRWATTTTTTIRNTTAATATTVFVSGRGRETGRRARDAERPERAAAVSTSERVRVSLKKSHQPKMFSL